MRDFSAHGSRDPFPIPSASSRTGDGKSTLTHSFRKRSISSIFGSVDFPSIVLTFHDFLILSYWISTISFDDSSQTSEKQVIVPIFPYSRKISTCIFRHCIRVIVPIIENSVRWINFMIRTSARYPSFFGRMIRASTRSHSRYPRSRENGLIKY